MKGVGGGGGRGVLPLKLPERQRALEEINTPNESRAITDNTANALGSLKAIALNA